MWCYDEMACEAVSPVQSSFKSYEKCCVLLLRIRFKIDKMYFVCNIGSTLAIHIR